MIVRGLILLDRDGVLNRMRVDPEQGTIDSPLHPSQVLLLPGVPESLKRLNDAGYVLAIVSNQPAAAKGKTTRQNLDAVHTAVIAGAESGGAKIASSHLCFHRSEDGCLCRKPKIALLEAALAEHSGVPFAEVWMVGDGITDIDAGARIGVKTAFLGPWKCDARKIFDEAQLDPDFKGQDLTAFVDYLLERKY